MTLGGNPLGGLDDYCEALMPENWLCIVCFAVYIVVVIIVVLMLMGSITGLSTWSAAQGGLFAPSIQYSQNLMNPAIIRGRI